MWDLYLIWAYPMGFILYTLHALNTLLNTFIVKLYITFLEPDFQTFGSLTDRFYRRLQPLPTDSAFFRLVQ